MYRGVLQHSVIASMAGRLCEQWLRQLATHTLVLADPAYLEDPRAQVSAKIAQPRVFKPIVAAITRQLDRDEGAATAHGALTAGLLQATNGVATTTPHVQGGEVACRHAWLEARYELCCCAWAQ